MDIICNDCQSRFRIPDEKIPAGKTASFSCPKCKNRIVVDLTDRSDDPDDLGPGEETTYDAAEKPFDFIETEGKTALICESDPVIKKTVIAALQSMAYHITDAQNAKEALKQMWYHVFDLIVMNELFDTDQPDTNRVWLYLTGLSMSVRRNIFVAMTSKQFRTMDQLMAFNRSVNVIIHINNMDHVERILRRGLSDRESLYRIYKANLNKAIGI